MTIRELAKLTGSSYATVSRALNDNPNVAPETRKRIKKIAKKAGYQINAGAKSLATGIHMTIGVLYPYHHLRAVESIYTVRLMHMIRDELAKYHFDTLIHGYDTLGEDVSDLTRLVREKKVDGLLVMGYEITEEAVLEAARYTDNFILINPIHSQWIRRYDHILIDHFHGGALAAKALLETGRKRLVTVAENSPQFQVRVDGFVSVVKDRGDISLKNYQITEGSYEEAYRFGTTHLEDLKLSDGVFVQSDNSAFGLMNALQDHGLSIPGDISIVGYDDVDWCSYSRPALSTIHQPKTDIVVKAAERITNRVLHKDSEPVMEVYKPLYVERESA